MNQRHVIFVCLILSVLYWCPHRHVGCTVQQESSSTLTNFAQDEHLEEKAQQDVTGESGDVKTSDANGHGDSLPEYSLKTSHQHVNTEQSDFPEPGPEPSVGLEEPPSIAASTDNISSSTTSENSSFLQNSAIENSSDDIPILSYEQSKADCDAGGETEAIPQSKPPSYVSIPEGPPEKPSDGRKTSSNGQGSTPEPEISEIPKTIVPEADEQKPAIEERTLNASQDLLNEELAEDTEVSRAVDAGDSSVIPSKDSGDIPSFDEWKKKVMEEEKEKSQSLHTSSGALHSTKKLQKNFNNYASVECGAKILAANPEAKSNSAILMENMDLYMLNPCSAKIWFVIELCEPIQVRQLDIANFELFSSTPKDFLVSISDRYPTNKWVKLGTFHALDERTVQSFPLDEQMYAKYVKMFIKYIKVELVSHFGSEHFCPLSLIRVFGTSMVEEYEEIAESQYNAERLEFLDEDYDFPLDYGTREEKSSKNLLGSATNAILNMVNIAANILGAKNEAEEMSQTEVNGSARPENETSKLDIPVLGPSPTSSLPEPDLVVERSITGEGDELEQDPSDSSTHKENLIVQLVQDEDEELVNRQSTVTLLKPGDDDEDYNRGSWFETETQMYCSELPAISCISNFPEYIYKRCFLIVALLRQRSLTLLGNDKVQPVPDIHQLLSGQEETVLVNETKDVIKNELDSLSAEMVSKVISESQSSTDLSENLTNQTDSIELEPSHPPPASHSPEVSTSDIKYDVKCTAILQSSDDVVTDTLADQVHLQPELTVPIVEQGTETKLETPQKETTDVPEETLLILETESANQTSLGVLLNGSVNENQEIAQIPITPTVPIQTADSIDEQPATEIQNETTGGKRTLVETEVALLPSGSDMSVSSAVETKDEDQTAEDILLSVPSSNGLNRTVTDFYAELHNVTDLGYTNGNQVHGSNQKESVFMRLNNRIKALEMNMSLSSRYLEELSQRYRKQMEEMQKAFNKTIIKLQNTSRIAEEKDQRQTEAIGLLQGQLANMTQLVRNLSETMKKLDHEVSDRQSYLVVSLAVCIILAVLLCVQRCWNNPMSQDGHSPTVPKSNHYPSPKRCFSSYDDMNIRRRTSFPFVRSKSFQLPTTEVGPDDLYIVEPLKFLQDNKKKKRCRTKIEKVHAIKPIESVIPMVNGGIKPCKPLSNPSDFSSTGVVYSSSHKGPPSEGGSETSSQSEESYFCGISACTSLCNGQPQKTKTEKRSLKRKKSKVTDQGKFISNLIQTKSGSMPSLHDIIKGNKDITVGAFGVTTVSGHV
ncbi:SUN domain-containing ossification factor isoform X2 [Scyliorhinus canicula]|uniref:SUN domain-containing ossification factor isoform X2 n=1 Tax=Scyliorhinus canicula TaxID=7830 RepID=UPI0018F3C454|nr:SUN domain-containing ossification factor isoform X2 [Scyliorhinus canicula]